MKKVFKYDITYFMYLVLIVLIWYPFGIYSGLIKERNPCFSGIPDPVICNKSQRILINDIQYERNCWSCGCKQCCSDGISCEKFRVSDSWENYYIYNAVSGSIENTYITKQKLCPNTGNERKYTNQVHLKFECASEEKIIDFCSLSNQTNGESVYLQYKRPENKSAKRDCYCYASTSRGGLKIQAVDIRFQDDSLGKCGRNQNSYLQFDSANNTIKCHDDQLLGGKTVIFNTSSSSIYILLHIDGHPQSVWIGITASTGSDVNVTCENTPPTEIVSTMVVNSNETSSPNSVTTSPTDVTKSSMDVVTISSTSLTPKEPKRSMNADRTTEVIRTLSYTRSIQTSDFDPATTDMTQYTALQLETSNKPIRTTKFGNLSTSPENTLIPKETFIKKITTGKIIDPAIIVLILTGVCTLVLVIIGVMLGRKRYIESRLDRNHSGAIREPNKLDTDENKKLNEYTSFTQNNESHMQHHEIKDDNSSPVYSQVEKKRQSGQLSNEYDHGNYQGSVKSMNSDTDNEPDYSHLRLYNNPARCYGQYDKVELRNIENNSQTLTRPIVLQASIEPYSDSEQGQQYINPYVDEAVIKGMVIDNELRRSLASSIDFDESIRDMMSHATSWAGEDSSAF